MARYWQATTFTGFYVEGRNQEKRLAQQLHDALDGTRLDDVMGAGIYIWLGNADDPSLRIKDIGDRTLIEIMHVDRSLLPKKAPKTAAGEEEEGSGEGVVETPPLPPTGGEIEDLRMRVDGILGGMHTKVEGTPPEFHTKVDLKLKKWQKPQPMAISSGMPTGEAGDLEGAVRSRGGGGGGFGGAIVMVLVVIALGIGGYYMLTHAGDDPYYIYMPGTTYYDQGTALGFLHGEDSELVVINVPTRLDTIWGTSPRFVRAEEDTVTSLSFNAMAIEELRVNKTRIPSVILEPTEEEAISTANELDVAGLVWNQAETWERWFESEINRGLVRGDLERQEGQLYLKSGDNYVGLTLSDLLSDEQQLQLRYAENRQKMVLLEIRFQETYPFRTVRSAQSRRLFSAEVREVDIIYENPMP